MKLNLKKSDCLFDLETVGTNINPDRNSRNLHSKYIPTGNEETKTMRINP